MIESNYVNGDQAVLARQRVRMNLRMIVGLVLGVALLATINTSLVSAQATANTLKVSPVRSDVQIQPGTSQTVKTTVTNLTDQPITVRPIENDFIAGDERGTPALILDENQFAPTHSLKRFMKPLADVTIPAGQAKTISVTIDVPKDAQAGGYFGAVRFAPTNPDSGGQVNLSASVASLILMTVPGPATEDLQLTSFTVQQNGKNGTFFRSPDNLQAAFRFQNKGNVQLGPFGKISVKKGDKVVYEADFNNKNPRDVILPDSARRWEVALNNIDSFGHYTVSGTLTYGQKNQSIEVNESFWVVPMAVIIGAIVGMLLLIGIIVGVWLFLRSYKRRVLRNHGGGSSFRR